MAPPANSSPGSRERFPPASTSPVSCVITRTVTSPPDEPLVIGAARRASTPPAHSRKLRASPLCPGHLRRPGDGNRTVELNASTATPRRLPGLTDRPRSITRNRRALRHPLGSSKVHEPATNPMTYVSRFSSAHIGQRREPRLLALPSPATSFLGGDPRLTGTRVRFSPTSSADPSSSSLPPAARPSCEFPGTNYDAVRARNSWRRTSPQYALPETMRG